MRRIVKPKCKPLPVEKGKWITAKPLPIQPLYKETENLQEHERSTPTQEKLLKALLELLHRKQFHGAVYYNCLVPALGQNRKTILRRPDIFIPRLGIIIEDDGSAHDDCNNRIHRDLSREKYAAQLKSDCIRFNSVEILDPESLGRIMATLEKLIDFKLKNPNLRIDDGNRRVLIHRARNRFKKNNPQVKVGGCKFNRHCKKEKPYLYPYGAWRGLVYLFDQSSYRSKKRGLK